MKKIATLMVISIFLVSGLALALSEISRNDTPLKEKNAREMVIEKTLHFSEPAIEKEGKYAVVKSPNTNTVLKQEGNPFLPSYTETVRLPLGTKIVSVDVETSHPEKITLSEKIIPTVPAISYDMKPLEFKITEGDIYKSTSTYPNNLYEWYAGVGIENSEHIIFLSIQLYPIRYIPANNELLYTNEMNIKVSYEPPEKPLLQNDEYDLVIIAPSEFSDALQPLVEHKESHGLKTKLVTLNEIYGGTYFTSQGRDDAEKVKYFIKNSIEEWGITYVMLVGGRHGGLLEEKWWCPVRYAYLDDGSNWEAGYLSDLYFADIYKYGNGNINFEDWDSNGNGIYAEWRMLGKDTIDMYPDVYVGRLACRNTFEVTNMVEKIIVYETTAYGKEWFKKMVVVGGDTFAGRDDPYFEGELSTSQSLEYMEGFDAVKLYTSDQTLGDTQDVISAISQGCGFLNFEGHGNPMEWATHPPNNDETWVDGLKVGDMSYLSNKDMYPICVVGGCHNSQFNVSLLNLLKLYEGYSEWYGYIYKGEMSPESWSWWIVRMTEGGAIASIGCTGLGYGTIGDYDNDGIPDCIQYLGGFIDSEFFRVYAQEGKDILGETHGTALTNYIAKFPSMQDKIDAKTVEEWVLLGDPSLKIGGYPS